MAAPPPPRRGGGGSAVSPPSLPPPRPKSPPEYPDLYGKRREAARVQMLEREIGFLEVELKFVEGIQPASRYCKEVSDFVVANSDPLIPAQRKSRRACRIWKWLCSGIPCLNLVSFCCCCQSECSCHLRRPKCCDCECCRPNCCGGCDYNCNCYPTGCCSCPSCSDCCPKPSCSSCCSFFRGSCCSCPDMSCCGCIPRCCCSCRWPSCPKSTCCRCKCRWSSCFTCPKLRLCCCNCRNPCSNPCCLAF